MSNLPQNFDCDVYRIANNFGFMANDDLINHWISYGQYENRIYKMPDNFNYDIYREENNFINWNNEENIVCE